jgi:hypothetical protein
MKMFQSGWELVMFHILMGWCILGGRVSKHSDWDWDWDWELGIGIGNWNRNWDWDRDRWDRWDTKESWLISRITVLYDFINPKQHSTSH